MPAGACEKRDDHENQKRQNILSQDLESSRAMKNLRFKINAAIFMTCILIAVIFGTILWPAETARRNASINRIRLLLEAVFEQRKEDLANEIFAGHIKALNASLEEMVQVDGVRAIKLYDPGGQLMTSTEELDFPPIADTRINPNERESLSRSSFFRKENIPNRVLFSYTAAIKVDGKCRGYLKAYYDMGAIEREAHLSMTVFILLLLIIVFVVTGILHMFLFSFVIGPVNRLREAMKNVRAGRFGDRVDTSIRGEIGDLVSVYNEMSENLRNEQDAINKAEEKYRSIFENAIEGIAQSTPDSGRFLTVNPSMAAILGYDSPDELISSISDFANQLYVNPQDNLEFNRLMKKNGRVVEFETQLYRRDKSVIWVSVSARCIRDDSGTISHYEGSFIDITERKEKERAEKESDAAEAANLAKSEFLAKMSHEIRTPLNAIFGFAELLRGEIKNEEHKEQLEAITSGGETLLKLIDDILDLSKIEAGRVELHYRAVNPRSILNEIRNTFSEKCDEKGIDFGMIIDPGLPDYLVLDGMRLRQILHNLVDNAVKFTDRGLVELSVESRFADRERTRVALAITVRDAGSGIPEERKQLISESLLQVSGPPFLKTDAATYDGAGLGLAISGRLAEIMGGKISVQSAIGKGSVFLLMIKDISVATDGEDPTVETDIDPDSVFFDHSTVLIADDTPTNRELLKNFLEVYNFTVFEAETGKQAIESATAHFPDLVLMDMKMPVTDGYEATRTLKDNAETKHIPIIATTASTIGEIRDRMMVAGCDGFIVKPFDRKNLVIQLMRFLPHSIQDTEDSPEDAEDTGLGPFLAGKGGDGGISEETLDGETDEAARLNILLMEDNKNNQMLFAYCLKGSPHRLDIAENGKIGLEKFVSGNYDLVFMDVEMPVMGGYEATERIREWEADNLVKPVPIIAVTAHGTEKVKESLKAGCSSYMIKPIKKDLLLKKIDMYAKRPAHPP